MEEEFLVQGFPKNKIKKQLNCLLKSNQHKFSETTVSHGTWDHCIIKVCYHPRSSAR